MGQPDDKNVQGKMLEVTNASASNVLEDAGPTEMSGPEVEYGFISRIISDSGSDNSESTRHGQHE